MGRSTVLLIIITQRMVLIGKESVLVLKMVFKKLRYNTLKIGLNIFMEKKMLLPLLKFNKYLEKYQDTLVS